MQELIIEIAIYLGIAAFLGFLLAYLIWGMGARRRIAAARAEGAAEVRTSVDGDTSLRTQIDKVTRERDRLEHRVQVLSARVASLMEGAEDPDRAEHLEKEFGTVQLRIEARPDDPMDGAAAAFPNPLREKAPEESIFEAGDDAESKPEDQGTDGAETPEDPAHSAPAPDTASASGAPSPDPDRHGGTAAGDVSRDSEADATLSPLRRTHPAAATEPDADEGGSRRLFEAASALRGAPSSEESTPASEADNTIPADTSPKSADPPAVPAVAEEAPPENDKDDGAAAEQGAVVDEAVVVDSSSSEDVQSGDQDDNAPVRTGHVPAGLFTDPPEVPDDLTRIKGIAKSTCKALNGKGIWTFSQLAAMSREDIKWLRSELGGQMARSAEKWVEQAKSL